MSTIVEGVVRQYPPMEQGVTQSTGNPWYKQLMIIETYGQYPKKVALVFFGSDKINQLQSFPIGSPVKVSVNAESREYNGKWFTDLNAWKVENGSATAQPAASAPAPQPAQPVAGFGAYPTTQAPPAPGQPLQQVVNQAQQNYQVQPVWDGQKWVHPHTGQPWAAPAPQQAAQPAPQPAPAPAPMAPAPQPQQQFAAPQQAAPAPQAPAPQFQQPAPQQQFGAPAPGDWNSQDLPF